MTYEERYMQAETPEELNELVKHDMAYAAYVNRDREYYISLAYDKVLKVKRWDSDGKKS